MYSSHVICLLLLIIIIIIFVVVVVCFLLLNRNIRLIEIDEIPTLYVQDEMNSFLVYLFFLLYFFLSFVRCSIGHTWLCMYVFDHLKVLR